MPFSVPTAQTYPWDVPLSRHLAQLNSPTTGGINTWATNPTVGVDGAALGTNHVGYTGINTKDGAIVRWDGTKWVYMISGEKVPYTNILSLYVNQLSGSDTNDGLTSTGAFKTISRLYQELVRYNLLERQVNVYLGPGKYIIQFPDTTYRARIRLIGESSSLVRIQNLYVYQAQKVFIQGVTFSYPELPDSVTAYYSTVRDNSSVVLGSDCVFGQFGQYSPGKARIGMYAINNGAIELNANCPITVTGDYNLLFANHQISQIWCSTYWNSSTYTNLPNSAPLLDKGYTYDSGIGVLTPSDTTCLINFVGNRVLQTFFQLHTNSLMQGPQNWKLQLAGSVTIGKAYTLIDNSYIYGNVGINIATNGISYPVTTGPGSVDVDSVITGTVGI